MKVGVLIRPDLSETEHDLLNVLGEALARTSHELLIPTGAPAPDVEKGYGPTATHINKGILTTADTVIVYASDDTLDLIGSRGAWGTAHVIVILGAQQLRDFVEYCVVFANQLDAYKTTNPPVLAMP